MTDWGGSRSFFSATDNVLQFQADQRLQVDGDVGPKTRAAMHMALVALTPGEAARPEVNVAPVTEEKLVPVSVTPPSLDAPWWKSNEVITPSVIGGGASLLTAIGRHTVAEPLIDPCRVRRHGRLPLLAQERRSEGRRKAGRGDGLMFCTPRLIVAAAALAIVAAVVAWI
nr:peptidoglycan-binding domain-containing protein [Sinorhizobium meliloti]